MSKHAFVVDIAGREHLEEWRSVPEFGYKYEASNLGRIKGPSGLILKQRRNSRGYAVVEVSTTTAKNGSRETLVHRMVAMAFHGIPESDQECRHLNGIQTDNQSANLAWGSRSENSIDQVLHGTHRNVKKTHCDRGHEFNEENTYIRRNGTRLCLPCKRITESRARHRRRKALTSQ